MRMKKRLTKTVLKCGFAFLLSLGMCFGCISTNWMGAAPGSSEGITAEMNVWAAGGTPTYAAGEYYDAGTFTLSGVTEKANGHWNIESAASWLTDSKVTLPGTTQVNTSRDDGMSGAGYGVAKNTSADYLAPAPGSGEEYQYIAKGTAVKGSDGKYTITWAVDSWPAGNSGVAQADFDTQDEVKAAWGSGTTHSDEWAKHAPIWASDSGDGSSANFYGWYDDGDYDAYGSDGESQFKYGHNFLIWGEQPKDRATGDWAGSAWSVMNTFPARWGVDNFDTVDLADHNKDGNFKIRNNYTGGLGIKHDVKNGNAAISMTGANQEWAHAKQAAWSNKYPISKTFYSSGSDDISLFMKNNYKVDGSGVDRKGVWTQPNIDVLGYIWGEYKGRPSEGTGVRSELLSKLAATPGDFGKANVGSRSGFTVEANTFSNDGGDIGLRVYGLQSAVFTRPGSIWYGLKDQGKGGFAWGEASSCKSTGFSATDNPWEADKYRYPSITKGGASSSYLTTNSYVHAYNERPDVVGTVSSEFVWVMDGEKNPGSSNGILDYGQLSSLMHQTRIYTAYDDRGVKDGSASDLDPNGTHLVNSHVTMQVRTNVYFDATDDSMRVSGIVTGTRDADPNEQATKRRRIP